MSRGFFSVRVVIGLPFWWVWGIIAGGSLCNSNEVDSARVENLACIKRGGCRVKKHRWRKRGINAGVARWGRKGGIEK